MGMPTLQTNRWWRIPVPFLGAAFGDTDSTAYAHQLQPSRAVIFPADLTYLEILTSQEAIPQCASRCLSYRSHPEQPLRQIWEFAGHLVRLHRIITGCDAAELFHFADHSDRLFTIATAAYCALCGVPVVWHDLGFGDAKDQRWRKALRSLCCPTSVEPDPNTLSDTTSYVAMRKSRAVPRAIIYGDFENETGRFLVRRAFELVKHKYPRTEFTLVSLTASQNEWQENGGQVAVNRPCSENEIQSLFREGDILILLSAGGLSSFFTTRAAAAGYPIILNGKNLIPRRANIPYITAVRDSYSSLADEIIKLADDETYYRGFSAHI